MVAPPGFEPRSAGPEPAMLDRYTTGLRVAGYENSRNTVSVWRQHQSQYYLFVWGKLESPSLGDWDSLMYRMASSG